MVRDLFCYSAVIYRVPTGSGGCGRGRGRQWYVICFVPEITLGDI